MCSRFWFLNFMRECCRQMNPSVKILNDWLCLLERWLPQGSLASLWRYWKNSPVSLAHALCMGRANVFLHNLLPTATAKPSSEKALNFLYFLNFFRVLREIFKTSRRIASRLLFQGAELTSVIWIQGKMVKQTSGKLS